MASDSDSDTDEELLDNHASNNVEWNLVNAGKDTYNLDSSFPSLTRTGLNAELFPLNDVSTNDVEYFLSLFLSDEMFEMICKWTNRRAKIAFEQVDVEPNGDLPDAISKWRPVTVSEMKKMIGNNNLYELE